MSNGETVLEGILAEEVRMDSDYRIFVQYARRVSEKDLKRLSIALAREASNGQPYEAKKLNSSHFVIGPEGFDENQPHFSVNKIGRVYYALVWRWSNCPASDGDFLKGFCDTLKRYAGQ
jgi:hypothetical protein